MTCRQSCVAQKLLPIQVRHDGQEWKMGVCLMRLSRRQATSGMLWRIRKSTLDRPNHCRKDSSTEPLVRPVRGSHVMMEDVSVMKSRGNSTAHVQSYLGCLG